MKVRSGPMALGILSSLGLFGGRKKVAIPGGGSVTVPTPFEPVLPGDYRHANVGCLIAYRRHHSTMAGTRECNGMIAVGHTTDYSTIKDFKQTARAALTTRWAHAHESEGRWYGRPEIFPETTAEGPNGPELVGQLSVHMVGWTVYDAPGCLYAVLDRRGPAIAVWIFNRDGGEKQARRHAERIAASYQA